MATLKVFGRSALWGRIWRADRTTGRSRCGRLGPGPKGRARGRDGERSTVLSLAGWERKLIRGSLERTIRVWELETGVLDGTLTGDSGAVFGLLVHGERLFSASGDGSVRAWAVGTAAVARAEADDVGASGQHPRRTAASGSKLISGSWGIRTDIQCGVRVWDAGSPTCERTVRQPAGAGVGCLAAAGWEVWGGAGTEAPGCVGAE